MAKLYDDAEKFFTRRLDGGCRVLLVNPPVQERRYHWLRWNQPLELLRLSAWLKKKWPKIDVRLEDFLFPDEDGAVPKHKVKETWTGSSDDDQLWHFGQTFDAFGERLAHMLQREKWVPDLVVVTSLTSYWHVSIEKLLNKICMRLGRPLRRKVKLVLYGNYPRFEPEHASLQPDADAALTRTIAATGCPPDFELYLKSHRCLPRFFALDVEDPAVADHVQTCIGLQTSYNKTRGARPPMVTVAFFNDDICSSKSHIADVAQIAQARPKTVFIDGIAGVQPASLTRERLHHLKMAGTRSLFVEHARFPGGGLDISAYDALREVLLEENHGKKSGASTTAWLDGAVTGFVHIGLPGDQMDDLVRSTLTLNSYFKSIILKPHGYSPTIDEATPAERRQRWKAGPQQGSPQWFPYVGNGSALARADYGNLLRWQNVMNKKVKGTTFDFLDEGTVARMVRETLVAESWKPHRDAP
jgi:hypothetical protein